MAHDLEPGATPKTVFGFVTEALRRQREREITPFTVMSCDNLQGNGTLARTAFTAFARLREPELGDWIEIVDRRADRLTEIAQRQREDPDAFIANRDLFGDLADDERFAEAYRSALRSLHERGARATLEALARES